MDIGDIIILLVVSLIAGFAGWNSKTVDVDAIEWGYTVCEANGGLERVGSYDAHCVNGARFERV